MLTALMQHAKWLFWLRLSFSTEVRLEDVFVRGMKEIREGDLELAEQFGYTVKLAGSAKKNEDGIEVAVEPVFFPNSHPLGISE